MDAVQMRKMCAERAMTFVHDDTTIGLGAGRSIACLVEYVNEAVKKGLRVKVVTPSFDTEALCVNYGIEVVPTYLVEEVDVAFDGCGEVDRNLIASKGGGGIHTKEKIIAAMAKDYILLVDEERFTEELTLSQTVALEVLKDSLTYVLKIVRKIGGEPSVRRHPIKDSFTVSDDGNFLIDVQFSKGHDVKKLHKELLMITGVIETSLFVNEVTKVIVAGKSGVKVVTREQ